MIERVGVRTAAFPGPGTHARSRSCQPSLGESLPSLPSQISILLPPSNSSDIFRSTEPRRGDALPTDACNDTCSSFILSRIESVGLDLLFGIVHALHMGLASYLAVSWVLSRGRSLSTLAFIVFDDDVESKAEKSSSDTFRYGNSISFPVSSDG